MPSFFCFCAIYESKWKIQPILWGWGWIQPYMLTRTWARPVNLKFLKLWSCGFLLLKKKTGRFYPKHGDFKILDYRLSLQFQSVSSSIEVLLCVSDLFDADVGIFIFLYSTKMLFDGSLGIIRLFQKLLVCYWTHLPTFLPHNCLHLIKICAYSHVTI